MDSIRNMLAQIGLEVYRSRFKDAEIELSELAGLTDLQLKKKPLSIEDAAHRAAILAAIRRLPGNAAFKPLKVFISYPHKPDEHAELARAIFNRLKERNHKPWFDLKDIPDGAPWRDEITKGILNSDWIVACLSAHSVRDPGVCLNELGIALNLKAGDEALRTVLLEDEKSAKPPMSLTHVQWTDLTAFVIHRPKDPNDEEQKKRYQEWLDSQIDELIRSIETRSNISGDIEHLTKRLVPAGFIAEIAYKAANFAGREWLFKEIEGWRKEKRNQPVLWIKGPAGIGKSAIAARLAHSERSTVLGLHFCKWNDMNTHEAANVVRTMAFQIASRHSDYRGMLLHVIDTKFQGDRLINAGWQELYRELMANLLTPGVAIDAGRDRHLIVIDGLDEARQTDGSNEILELTVELQKLPQWLGVVVTSRPEQDIVSRLHSPFELDAQSDKNRGDIREFLQEGFKAANARGLSLVELNKAVEEATKRSDGIMLYAAELLRGIREGSIDLRDPRNFPNGLNGIFFANMRRNCPDIAQYRRHVKPLLELIAGCPLPLPEDLARAMLHLSQDAFGDAIKPMSSLFIQTGSRDKRAWTLFHRSLADWLTNPANRHDYQLENNGKARVGEFLWTEYEEARKKITALKFYQDDPSKGNWRERLIRKIFGKWTVKALGGSEIHISASAHLDSIDFILPACINPSWYRSNLGNIRLLTDWYTERGRYRAAITLGKQSLAFAEETLGPDNPIVGAELAHLAFSFIKQSSYQEAEPLLLRALGIKQKTLPPESPVITTVEGCLALIYEGQGRYAEAEQLLTRCLSNSVMTFGEEDRLSATSLDLLAQLYLRQGRFDEARLMLQKSLGIREKLLGSRHSDFVASQNNLAELYRNQGRYAEAEPLFRKALAAWEATLGAEHPDVATGLNNLALLYRHLGRHAEAEPLILRSLAIREKVLGTGNPEFAASLNLLASHYQDQSRYADAEPLFLRARAVLEKIHGLDHPAVATIQGNLSSLYKDQGRYAEAEHLYVQTIAAKEKALGMEHADVASSLSGLAGLLVDQGRYADAEPRYLRAMAIREKAFGLENPIFASSLHNLASLYHRQGRFDESEAFNLRALNIRERVLGSEHKDVLTSRNNLALLYLDQGRFAEAEPHFVQALAICEKNLGPEHLDVATGVNNLALLYQNQGRYQESEPLALRALAIWQRLLGPDHSSVAMGLSNLGLLYQRQGRYSEAESPTLQGLAIWEKSLGPEHPNVALGLSNLGITYQNQSRFADAEPFLLRALSIRKKSQGHDHPDLATALNNLAVNYSNQGRHDAAEPLARQALAILERLSGQENPLLDQIRQYLASIRHEQSDEVQKSLGTAIDVKAKTFQVSGASPTTGRNAPCPCGSGLRYKLCHGKVA